MHKGPKTLITDSKVHSLQLKICKTTTIYHCVHYENMIAQWGYNGGVSYTMLFISGK